MTKSLITLVIIAALGALGWGLWREWEKYSSPDYAAQQKAALAQIDPTQLQGMPKEWETGYKQATNSSLAMWKRWMQTYAQRVGDPRRAWIELDYMVRISTDDPQEAKAIFATVKDRITDTNSPVYPRVLQLEKTYD